MANEIRSGMCLCGQVRFKVTEAPVMTAACHCRGCQRLTASAFSLTAFFPVAGFEVTAGEPVIGALHGPSRHYFCPYCMSWLYTRPDGADAFVAVRTMMLDDPSGLDPFIDTMTAEKLPWAATPAVVAFEGFPSPEEYGPLMQAFAKSRVKPG